MQSPRSSPRGELLEQYVRARVVRMDGIDIGLFDYDRHNTLYYFILNAEEWIYLRYGGRDEESPTSYLDLDSFELALEQGLRLHRRYRQGKLEPPPRPSPFFPRQIESLARTEMSRGRCVECHLIADYQARDQERAGTLDRLQTLYASPDVRRIGIHLDVPRGLVVDRATGAAAAAGLRSGDLVSHLEGVPVFTFGDLQYRYDKVPRHSARLRLAVERRGRRHDLTVELPSEWWWTHLYFRYWSVEPVLSFSSERLEAEEKRALGLDPAGFACRVTAERGTGRGLHQLEVGDVIYAVDGETANRVTTGCDVHLTLTHIAGTTARLGVLRNGVRIEMTLRTRRQFFRKSP